MILTTHNGSKVRLYAGLYVRTKKQTRFWGWCSRGWGSWAWGSLRVAEAERPWTGLAEWLRQAHERLDRHTLEEPPAKPGNEHSLSE